MVPLVWRSQSGQVHRQKAVWWLPGAWGGGSEELVFSGDRVSLWEDENVEVGGGDGCIEV